MYVTLLFATLGGLTWFDSKPLYENPLANPRSPESGLSLALNSTVSGYDAQYIEGIIGKSFVIVDSKRELQLGIEASTWAMLVPRGGAFPLITQDFYFSIPLYFRAKTITGALKFNHISAHLGDGANETFETFLSKEKRKEVEEAEDEYGVDVNFVKPKSYSRDFVSLDLAHNWRTGRFYFRGGYLHKVYPEGTKRWFGGIGSELSFRDFYTACDVSYYQDTDSFGVSQQAGMFLSRSLVETRVAAMWYMGSDRRGQFMGDDLQLFGVGFFVR